jgi:hypothetical protein
MKTYLPHIAVLTGMALALSAVLVLPPRYFSESHSLMFLGIFWGGMLCGAGTAHLPWEKWSR